MSKFSPFYPKPHQKRSSFIFRFIRGFNSWIDVLFEKSYSMQMGHIHQFGMDVYMVNDPTTIKKVLIDQPEKYPKHTFMHQMLVDLLGNSIFTTNGEQWKHQREIINQGFSQTKVTVFFPQVKDSIADMINRLSNYTDQFIEIDSEMTYVTADVMFRVILSKHLDYHHASQIYRQFSQYQELIQKITALKFYKIPLLWRFLRLKSIKRAKAIRKIVISSVDERLEMHAAKQVLPQDILSTLIQGTDNKNQSFSREELIDQICMLFLAGHETSSAALSWAIYLIGNDLDIQNQIFAEVEEHCRDGISVDDINKLKYTSSVFHETLRLFPPVSFFMREATEDHILYDKFVKKGALIVISPWLMHRHRKMWNMPDAFCPERFNKQENKKTISQCYLPFSKGQRVCPGAGFAKQEAILILATIVKSFIVTSDKLHVPIPSGKITLRPKNGVMVKFTPRTDEHVWAKDYAPSKSANLN